MIKWKADYHLYIGAFSFVTAFMSPNEFGFVMGIVIAILNVGYWAVLDEEV